MGWFRLVQGVAFVFFFWGGGLRVWDGDSLGFGARCCLGDFRSCLAFLGLGCLGFRAGFCKVQSLG